VSLQCGLQQGFGIKTARLVVALFVHFAWQFSDGLRLKWRGQRLMLTDALEKSAG